MPGESSELISQIPPGVYILAVVFLGMIIVPLVLLMRRGGKQAQSSVDRQKAKAQWLASMPDDDVPPTKTPPASFDMPDLDLLLNPSSTPPPASPPPSAYAPPAQRGGTYRVKLSDGRSLEAADVLVISRDLAEGTLIVQVGQNAYPLGAYIHDEEARRRFTATLRDLVKSGGDMTKAPPEPEPAPEPEPVAPPSIEAPPVVEAAPLGLDSEPLETAPPRPAPPKAPKGEIPGDLPLFITDNEPLKLRGGKPKNPVPELDIAGAIEAYLQYKLERTPEFSGRRIHIHPAYGGGVKIEVDERFYEAVDEIDDAATRDFISTAIQEWQSRQ